MYFDRFFNIFQFNIFIFFNIACDRWSNPSNESIWNFVIHTDDHREYLWSLKNFSNQSHTSELLTNEIQDVIEKLGPKKFAAIVTDAGSNVLLARNNISTIYPQILNIRCIAHAINLISKDICKTLFANKMLRRCIVLVTFFKRSHLAGNILI